MDQPVTNNANLNHDGIHRDKLHSLGRLTAGVAHELNNPIGYIASNINSLSKYVKAMRNLIEQAASYMNEEQLAQWQELQKKEHWSFIQDDIGSLISETTEGAEHLKAVVADLKTLGRSSASPEFISPDSCINSALNVMTHQLKNNIQVDTQLSDCKPRLLIRPHVIQCIVNLIHNAIQAFAGAAGLLRIRCSDEGDNAIIIIADNGPGIPSDVVTHMFDPYFTTKDSHSGSGLGLAIVKHIASEHGGDIVYLENAELGGATFKMTLNGVPT